MAEHPAPSDRDPLGGQLTDLGRRLAYPPTPDLASRTGARLRAGQVQARPLWLLATPRRRMRLAVALVAALACAGVLGVPASRDAVAERLGLKGARITYVATVPPPAATPSAPLGSALGLGQAMTTLGEVQGSVSFPVLGPDFGEFGLPDAVYLSVPPPGGQVALVYRPRAGRPAAAETGVGMLFTQFRGTVEPYIEKAVGPGTRVERVTVNGRPGFWIEGRPHGFFYRDASGQVRQESIRLAGNTLLWEQDGFTLRLEAAVGRDEAIRIAAGVSPIGKK